MAGISDQGVSLWAGGGSREIFGQALGRMVLQAHAKLEIILVGIDLAKYVARPSDYPTMATLLDL